MSYDQWKLRCPEDEDEDESGYYDDREDDPCEHDPCEHELAEVDIMVGDWYCPRCGEHRSATHAEIDAEINFHRIYAEDMARERRREFWHKLTLPIRWPIFRLMEKIWPRKSLTVLDDSEIPF